MLLNSAQCVAIYLAGGISRRTARNVIRRSRGAGFVLLAAKFFTGVSATRCGTTNVGAAIGNESWPFLRRSAGNVCIAELLTFACLILTISTPLKRTSQRIETTQHRFG